MFAEVTNRPDDSWGKAVSVVLHTVIVVRGPGPRVPHREQAGSSGVLVCVSRAAPAPPYPGTCHGLGAGPAVSERLLGHSRGFP